MGILPKKLVLGIALSITDPVCCFQIMQVLSISERFNFHRYSVDIFDMLVRWVY